MIHQLNMQGKDKVQVAIDRLKTFEPPEGYYLAFSGGKDSVVIKALADMAGVKYDAHYTLTSVDPPELVQFIKTFDDVVIERPKDKEGHQVTMWSLIVKKKMPPTRMTRYCCDVLKEHGGKGRFTVTGVRWAESSKRRNMRSGLELNARTSKQENIDPDNPDNAQLARYCPTKGKHILNPIIDWTDEDIWEFIHNFKVPYCSLYDEGHKRLGCIGCPLSHNQKNELEQYPKYRNAYLHAFDRMIQARKDNNKERRWETAEEVMRWWVGDSND